MPNFRAGRASRPTRLTVALLVAGAAMLGACTAAPQVGATPGADGADLPVVLTTFTVLADMAQVVAGPDARVESITGVGMEIHGYEPTPDDLRRAAEADLLLANGLGLEAWLQGLVAPLDLPTVILTEQIDPVPVTGGADGGPEGAHPTNPHAWMSPAVGRQYVAAIADALTRLDPPNAEGYAQRATTYSAQLGQVQEELVGRLDDVPHEQAVLVSCEGAFSYLARDAGLGELYLWPVNAERQGTPRQVGSVILGVRESGVPAVFCESTVSPAAQQQVARETGARFGGTLYVDSLSEADGPVPTYLDLLRHDMDVIVAGLTGQGAGA